MAFQDYKTAVQVTLRDRLPKPETMKRLTDAYARLLPHAQMVLGGGRDRYLVELQEADWDSWMPMENHSNIHDASTAAYSYSKHCDERSRIVDTSTGQTIEVWNEGKLEERNVEPL